jgi:hypothetical protein
MKKQLVLRIRTEYIRLGRSNSLALGEEFLPLFQGVDEGLPRPSQGVPPPLHSPPKRYPSTRLYGVTVQTTSVKV